MKRSLPWGYFQELPWTFIFLYEEHLDLGVYPKSILDQKVKWMKTSITSHLIRSCKEDLASESEMKEMGLIHCLFRLEVWQGDGELFVSQGKYANEILQRFRMDNCKPMETSLATNWRKEDATSSEKVDATVY